MRAVILVAAFTAIAADCSYFRKVVDAECAEACINSMVGLCPQALVVKEGGLDAGHCKDLNFTVADGSQDQKAGPCGTITFNQFKKSAVGAAAAATRKLFHHQIYYY